MSSNPYHVTVERTINAPVGRAFTAWADPGDLSQWFTTDAQQDFRVGGRYSNGDNDRGEFLAIVPNEHIQFTWDNPQHSPGTLIDIRFRPSGDTAVDLIITHSLLSSPDAIPGFEEGWNWALDSLKSYLETGRGIRYAEWGKKI